MRKISYIIPPTDGWFWECPQCAASRHLSSKRQSEALSGSHWKVYRRSTLADFATVRASRYKVLIKPPLYFLSPGELGDGLDTEVEDSSVGGAITPTDRQLISLARVMLCQPRSDVTSVNPPKFTSFLHIYYHYEQMSINICSRRSVCLLKKRVQILCVKLFVNFQFFNILPLKISL